MHVVLTAECVDTTAWLADVTEKGLDKGNGTDVVDTNSVLRDTKTVDKGSLVLALVEPLKGLLDLFCRYTTYDRGVSDAVFVLSNAGFELLVTVGAVLHELFPNPAPLNDLLHQAVTELAIGSWVVLNAQVSRFGGRRAPAVPD